MLNLFIIVIGNGVTFLQGSITIVLIINSNFPIVLLSPVDIIYNIHVLFRDTKELSPSKQPMLNMCDIIIKGPHWCLNFYQRCVSGSGLVKKGIEKGNGPRREKSFSAVF